MADPTTSVSTDHMPRTEAGLAALNVRERIMLSAAAASGSDAVAYYAADGKGGFRETDHVDLYDFNHKHPTSFPSRLSGFQGGTFADEAAVRRTSEQNGDYQLAVTGKDGTIQGIIVLHPPKDGYMRVQNTTEAEQNEAWRAQSEEQRTKTFLPDGHEAAVVRLHKLQMASDIVEREKVTLLSRGEEVLQPGQAVGSHKERDAALLGMAKDLAKTFPTYGTVPEEVRTAVEQARNAGQLRSAEQNLLPYEDNMQAAHLKHTGDLMHYTGLALNEGQSKPLLNDKQLSRIELLAMLHDAGKTQAPYTMFQNAPSKGDTKEQKDENAHRQEDYTGRNANHDYFDKVVLPLDPAAGSAIGNHHHGNRYTEEDLIKNLGGKAEVEKYEVHTDHNVPSENISTFSRMLRVNDVTEAITARTDKSMTDAVQAMALQSVDFGNNKDGKPKTFKEVAGEIAAGGTPDFSTKTMGSNTIDRDALCFMIEHHVFEKYSQQRDAEEKAAGNKGWSKYNQKDLQETEASVLKMLHWDERKKEMVAGPDGKTRTVEDNLRMSVRDDALFKPSTPTLSDSPRDSSDLVGAGGKAIHEVRKTLSKFGGLFHAHEHEANTPKETPVAQNGPATGQTGPAAG